jgi:two-component system, OmpR family, response regulator
MAVEAPSGQAMIRMVCPPPKARMQSPTASATSNADRGGSIASPPTAPFGIEPAMGKARILVVASGSVRRQGMVEYLGERYRTSSCAPAQQEILRAISRLKPQLILLDMSAGERQGFHLLQEIRSRFDAPIILLTGHTYEELERIRALELGADDFLEWSGSPRELMARIRAILRRCELTPQRRKRPLERGGFRFAGWQLHRRSRRLIAPGGKIVPITKGEYALLLAFLGTPQYPLSREQLLHATRVHDDIFDRSIDVQVLRLRRKLEIDPAAPRFIHTERGVGYVFAIPVEAY